MYSLFSIWFFFNSLSHSLTPSLYLSRFLTGPKKPVEMSLSLSDIGAEFDDPKPPESNHFANLFVFHAPSKQAFTSYPPLSLPSFSPSLAHPRFFPSLPSFFFFFSCSLFHFLPLSVCAYFYPNVLFVSFLYLQDFIVGVNCSYTLYYFL